MKFEQLVVGMAAIFVLSVAGCVPEDEEGCCGDDIAVTYVQQGMVVCEHKNGHRMYKKRCPPAFEEVDDLDAGTDADDTGSDAGTDEPDVSEPDASDELDASEPDADTSEPDTSVPDADSGQDTGDEPDAGESDGGDTGPEPLPDPDYGYLERQDMRFLYTWAGGNYRGDDIVLNESFRHDYIDFLLAPHGYSDQGFNRVALQPIMYTYGDTAYHFGNCQRGEDRFVYLAEPVFDPLRGSDAVSVSYSGDCSGTLTMPAVSPDDMRDTLRDLHAGGVDVDFLDGQAIWLAEDHHAQRPLEILQDVLDFNRASSDPAERFDGIHFDIEPHIVGSGPYGGDWWEGRQLLTYGYKYNPDWEHRWIDILREARLMIDQYVEETGHAFSLSEFQGSDTPFYREYHMKEIDAADDNVHFLVIGNYFDGRDNINGQNSFFYGDQEYDGQPVTGGFDFYFQYMFATPVVFAAETGGDAPDWASFGHGGGVSTTGPYDGYEGMFYIFDLAPQLYQLGTLGLGAHHGGYPNDNGIRTMQPSY